MKPKRNLCWYGSSWALWCILGLGIPLRSSAQTPPPGGLAASGLRWQTAADAVALLQEGATVWRFNYSSKLTKTYFHPVALPGGSALTWLSPADHVHHYALFFTWKYLNKVNYWEEPAGPHGLTTWSNVKIETRPDFSAGISLDLQYHPQGAANDVLTEKRTIRISAPAADGSYCMDWHQEFTAGLEGVVMDRTPPNTRPDGNARGGYAGLSIRLAKELSDPRVTATADIGALESNRYGFAAGAAEFSGRIDHGEVGVALLNHPANPRSPCRWYGIMDQAIPFWFLNASWLQLEPFTLPARQKLTLQYRVLIHPRRWDAERLQQELDRYLQATR